MDEELSGILLDRKDMKTWDELVTFFTRERGIVDCYSFGSRSAKSGRSRLMAGRDWLTISLEKKGRRSTLKELSRIRRNDFLSELEWFHQYMVYLRTVRRILPYDTALTPLYDLLYDLSDQGIIRYGTRINGFLFDYSLLKIQGVYPYYTQCSVCGLSCSESYFYHMEREDFIGRQCDAHYRAIELSFELLAALNAVYRENDLTPGYLATLAAELAEDESIISQNLVLLQRLGRLLTDRI